MTQTQQMNPATLFGELEAIEGIRLTEAQVLGDVAIIGKASFMNLETPGGAPGIPPKYGADVQIPKGSDDARILFAVFNHIAGKAWGEGSEKSSILVNQLANGLSGMNSNISVDDGDLVSPEFNGGFWLVKTRNAMRFALLGEDGRPTDQPASKGDAIRLVFSVWAQKSRERINLKTYSVQVVIRGVDSAGPPPEVIAEVVAGYASQPLPALVAGVTPVGQALPANVGQAAQAAPGRPPLVPDLSVPQVQAQVPLAAAQGVPQGLPGSIFRGDPGKDPGKDPVEVPVEEAGGPDIIEM